MSRRGVVASVIAVAFAAALTGPAGASAGVREADTVWLCKPGQDPNPCRESLETTVFAPDGSSRVERPPNALRPKVDCFYVYPTVSEQPTLNADFAIDPQQTAIARYQAARFSRRCRVFAPVYRQLTLAGIFGATDDEAVAAAQLAYTDVRAAWRDYLRNHNRGRGVVLIGHSQGTYMLRYLIRNEIDSRPGVRRRLVSALLLGGNVTVREGKRKGGDFEHIRSCVRMHQFGCVAGFSTFNQVPPPDARFGFPSQIYGGAFGFTAGPGYEVLCTNPAALGGGPAPLETLTSSEPFPGTLGAGILLMYGGELPTASTPWVQPPERFSGECVHAGGAQVLMLSPIEGARTLIPSPNPAWGLHLADVNIALGDLVRLVAAQATAYRKARRTEH
jgi:Protein of unknown function (DUF3089)